MLASVVLILLTYPGRALRWMVMLRPLTANGSFVALLNSTVIGFTAIVLFGRPGELVRPYLIAKKSGVSLSSQLAAWLLERIYDLLCVILIFGFALTSIDNDRTTLGPGLQWVLTAGGWILGAIGIVCLAVLFMVGGLSERSGRRLREGMGVIPDKYRVKVEGFLLSFAGGMSSTRSRSHVLKLVLYTILEWVIIIAAHYCLFQAFAQTAHLTWADTMVFIGFIAFGSVVQVPGIGGGMQVAAIIVLTEIFGLRLEAASGVSILIWLTMSVAVVPIGLILAFMEGLSWSSLRSIKATEPNKMSAGQ
jgi:uncharacterized protein (TIRG00374 family)